MAITPSSPLLVQTFADNFQRPNEQPLNPALWKLSVGDPSCAIVSNLAVGDLSLLYGRNIATYVPTFADQYVKVTVQNLATSQTYAAPILRGVTSGTITPGYWLQILGPMGGGGAIVVLRNGATAILTVVNLTISAGDVFFMAVQGSLITVYQNNTLLGTVVSTTITTPGGFNFYISDIAAQSDVQISNFQAGLINPPSAGPTSGFAPSVVNGVGEAGLQVYVSGGTFSGVSYTAAIVSVVPQAVSYIYASVQGTIAVGTAVPGDGYGIALVTASKVIVSGNKTVAAQVADGITSITDIRQ